MRRFVIAALVSLVPMSAMAAPLTMVQKRAIDESTIGWLAGTGARSVSIAVVSGNDIAYAKAYGNARRRPPDTDAGTKQTRYEIGSISKQFTAAAVLLLQERRKLSLDDIERAWPDGRIEQFIVTKTE